MKKPAKRKNRLKKVLRWIRNSLLSLFVLSLALVLLYKYVPVRYTPRLFSMKIEQLFRKEKIPVRHRWTPLSGISQNLVRAVIASEDNLFLMHNGFDFNKSEINPGEISRSRYKWKTGTISQQTAHAVFLFPGKSDLNKIPETYFTFLIEFVWGKERIMEIYLNSIELGDGIFGAEAIAQNNFQISAAELTVPQAALITVSINNPKELDSARPTVYMLRRQAKIISLMEKMIPVEWGKCSTGEQNDFSTQE
ncbi:MAG: monofunctional biosynthetic peptidoglycan transglycosylase [Candidatus Symbiothrix sp.]|jgi:monofunctional biosynthetic peptidoglycan transglycosylase|nr:monofunctional biosynthetic peptidoglycan transglycosylase [Candidatus Symbiothrix sp.]